jgi:O-methyltransferase involved in polyketide biosynthesis
MPEKIIQNLSPVAETLLIPLCVRALEAQRPDALFKDEKAAALVQQIGCDPAHILEKVEPYSQAAVLLRNLKIDRDVQDFIGRHPDAVVVQIGCGLDVRFERVDNGQVEWYDLDLPEVIALRRELIGGEKERYHLLACSVLEDAWLDVVSAHRPRPFLFLAESVLMYFTEAQVRQLVLAWKERFPGAELLFDAFSPLMAWANNLRVSKTGVGAPFQWGLKRPRELESWGATSSTGAGIRLLEEWYPFRCDEPRLGKVRAVRNIPFFAKSIGLFHYQLGEA